MEKFQNRYGVSSKLQEDILRYICRNANGTYYVLAKFCNKNVRTIGQSIRTLEKNFYLERQLLKEGKNRRKYIVVPTFKGINYGLAFLDIGFLEVIKTYSNESEGIQYPEYIQQIKDYDKMSEYLKYNSRSYFENNLFDKGNAVFTNFEQALSIGVKIGLSATIQTNSDSSIPYFAEQGIKVAADILPPRKVNDLKNFMDDMMQNFTKGITKEIKKLDS